MGDKKTREVFCHSCGKYTNHYISNKVEPINALAASYRCEECESIPTLYNLIFASQKENEELDCIRNEINSSEALLVPKPLFKIGEICLVRDDDFTVYAHGRILGVKHKIQDAILSDWEYYVSIYGKSEVKWLNERNLRQLDGFTGGTDVNERTIVI